MPKRSHSKPSRSKRKEQRRKSARAVEHGLPNRVFERPSQRPTESGRPLASRQENDADTQTDSDSEPALPRTLYDRVSGLPLAVKLAVMAAIALALIGVFAYSRGPREPIEQSVPRGTSAPVPPKVEAPPALPELPPPEPPARALPSAEHPPSSPAPTTAQGRSALRPTAPPAPSVEPTADRPPPKPAKPPPTSPPAQTGTRDPLEPPSSLSGSAPQPRLPETSPPAPAPPIPTTIPAPTPLPGKPKARTPRDNPY